MEWTTPARQPCCAQWHPGVLGEVSACSQPPPNAGGCKCAFCISAVFSSPHPASCLRCPPCFDSCCSNHVRKSRVADRVLVLWPGVSPEPLRWESRVQDVGPPETSQPHVISNGKSSPTDLHLHAKTQLHSTTSRLQRWTPCAKQLARQEHSPTH